MEGSERRQVAKAPPVKEMDHRSDQSVAETCVGKKGADLVATSPPDPENEVGLVFENRAGEHTDLLRALLMIGVQENQNRRGVRHGRQEVHPRQAGRPVSTLSLRHEIRSTLYRDVRRSISRTVVDDHDGADPTIRQVGEKARKSLLFVEGGNQYGHGTGHGQTNGGGELQRRPE